MQPVVRVCCTTQPFGARGPCVRAVCVRAVCTCACACAWGSREPCACCTARPRVRGCARVHAQACGWVLFRVRARPRPRAATRRLCRVLGALPDRRQPIRHCRPEVWQVRVRAGGGQCAGGNARCLEKGWYLGDEGGCSGSGSGRGTPTQAHLRACVHVRACPPAAPPRPHQHSRPATQASPPHPPAPAAPPAPAPPGPSRCPPGRPAHWAARRASTARAARRAPPLPRPRQARL